MLETILIIFKIFSTKAKAASIAIVDTAKDG